MLRMKTDYECDEFVTEFTEKVLGKDYPKFIFSDTIGGCFDNIAELGMVNAEVVKCDISQLTNYVRGLLSEYRKYLCREVKNVASKDYKKRLTVYDNGKGILMRMDYMMPLREMPI